MRKMVINDRTDLCWGGDHHFGKLETVRIIIYQEFSFVFATNAIILNFDAFRMYGIIVHRMENLIKWTNCGMYFRD